VKSVSFPEESLRAGDHPWADALADRSGLVAQRIGNSTAMRQPRRHRQLTEARFSIGSWKRIIFYRRRDHFVPITFEG
jgi:hypothetical protein